MKVVGLLFALVLIAVLVLLSFAAYAAGESPLVAEGYGVLTGGFLGFASLIISAKLVPGLIRFASIIKEEAAEGDGETIPVPSQSTV